MTASPASTPGLSVSDRTGRRVVRLDRSPFTIGRQDDSDLRVAGSEVSRRHAEIVSDGGRYVLRDCGSRYGTFVNGELQREHVLIDGDRIRLGRSAAVDIVFLNQPEEPAAGGSLVGIVRQTAALLDGLRALGAVHVLQDVLILVLDAAIDVSGAERGFIMLAGADGVLEFTIGRARGRITLPGRTFDTSRKIPSDVFVTGEARVVGDLIEGGADEHSATVALGIRQVLCVPLRLLQYFEHEGAAPEPKRIGVLYLDGREDGGLLSPTTRIAVETLASEAAVAIENARLYRESVEKARVDRELRIAAEMQRALRPAASHCGADFEVAGASQASRAIGGDFFDYGELPDGGFGLALGDVAGKGPPAAVLAGALQGMVVAYATSGISPGEALRRINLMLERHFTADRFATMTFAVLRPGGRFTYSLAGHNPPLLLRGGRVERLETGGMPLALFTEAQYPEESRQLQPGDAIVFFSDGVTEASNEADEPFGDDRVAAVGLEQPGLSAEVFLERLLDRVHAFCGGVAPADDLTAMVLRYTGGPPGLAN
jgi:phosphoserine phosphatase RsbU/P